MLGFRGHFSTKSRTYSTTLGTLRADRAAHQREYARAAGLLPHFSSETAVVVADWHFAGHGDLLDLISRAAAAHEPSPVVTGGAACPGSC
jgi:hypothetical protein